ncbi:RagB/SusD family nutrient uptake outer membrane protein [Dysgonomonas reticulitermitis]
MKKYIYGIIGSILMSFSTSSCVDLDFSPTVDLSSDLFWTTTADATSALNGVYNATRTFFHRTYGWDGGSDVMWGDNIPNHNLKPNSGIGSTVDAHWRNGYQVINRANSTLEHVEEMLNKYPEANTQKELKRVKGELYFLRAIVYFRLMDLWGDIPFYTHVLNGNTEAYSLVRTPRKDIKDQILADLDFAKENVPITVAASERGRATRASVYGFSGKIKLYWACWMKNDNKQSEATEYYRAAATDFAEVMKPEYGLKLFRNGEPGTAENPNYLDLFDGRNEYNEEVIFATSNAGPNLSGVGDPYVYDFGTRSTGNGGANAVPNLRLMDRYQLLSTGDYADPLVVDNDVKDPVVRAALPNGACNPASYVGRDYRIRSCMWDGQTMPRMSVDGLTVGPDILIFKYNSNDNVTYINAQGPRTGFIFRKYVRTYAFGGRESGQQDTYLMRLPDLWLMYCEAVNEVNNGPTSELFSLIDKIRYRGALPSLDRNKFATKETFFKAIEQERIVELIAEGHRFFDIRRWKMVEKLWPAPDGFRLTSTWGEYDWYRDEFKNAEDRDYQRFYIFKIPQSEINQNPNLIQNDCWL